MIASKNHIQSMNVDTIYFGHYGASSNVTEVYKQLEHWLPIFVHTGKEVFKNIMISMKLLKLCKLY